MSGGRYGYAYLVMERMAESLESGVDFDGRETEEKDSVVRLGFAVHLRKVAAAMQAIEWEDSGDCSPPHAAEAIWNVTGV
jgi:hypothetical protein